MGARALSYARADRLSTLPTDLLSQLVSCKPLDIPSRCNVRAACRALCEAFDGQTTRLVLGRPSAGVLPSAAELSALARRMPALAELQVCMQWQPRPGALLEAAAAEPLWRRGLRHLTVDGAGIHTRRLMGDTGGDVKPAWLDLSLLCRFEAIQRLELINSDRIAAFDLSQLGICTQLVHLDLSYSGHSVQDISALSCLSRLESVSIHGCSSVMDIAPLSGCATLTRLDMAFCTGVRSLGPLTALFNLRHLSIRGCTGVQDLGALAALSRLQCLDLALLGFVEGGVLLRSLPLLPPCLEHLVLNGCDNLSSLPAALLGATSLMHLDVSDCKCLRELSGLTLLTQLRHLSLSSCEIEDEEGGHLAPLSALVLLQHLDLESNGPIGNWSFLAALTDLRYLNLPALELEAADSLSSLRSCTALQRLVVSGEGGDNELPMLVPALPWLASLQLAADAGLADGGLSSCASLTSLAMHSKSSLPAGLSACTALRRLQLIGQCSESSDTDDGEADGGVSESARPPSNSDDEGGMQSLASLSALQHVHLSECSYVSRLEVLTAWTALQHLELCHLPHLRSLAPLAHCTALLQLCIEECSGVSDLAPLAACTALNRLTLVSLVLLVDLSPLSALAGLSRLRIAWCNSVRDLGPLSGLVGLRALEVSRCSSLAGLPASLSACVRLCQIGLCRCVGAADADAVVEQVGQLAAVRRLSLPDMTEGDRDIVRGRLVGVVVDRFHHEGARRGSEDPEFEWQ